ncbi:hydrolase [Streptomyces albiflavescens]|uniref:Hydrolase n=1 Tax=Streptomyces albiflavescens TaxID=1623582 RepID=A0A917Y138_9ACTN|nr:RICIN domain-containing protein [Streptomyces albiflavescens]GGN63182.1 hydrolase [Streptomyces albiflavescens]
MHTPHPPRPPYPPSGVPGESDESLAVLLRGRPESDAAHPVALLMARHWQSAYDYAVICLASSANVASLVTATSYHRTLDRLVQGESGLALRPQLLVTVRDTVKEWSADDRISGVLPDLRKPAGGRGMRAAKSMTAENRKLAERAFHALPALARCLLWHTEVEAEPISVPAGLSGMDTDMASAALEQAREQFREACVRAHRELAPSKECGFHNRLLDVPIRRGGALLPDVQEHLIECPYCRYAAEQLSHFEGGLGVLLAEAVLGWGARRYLDSRPGRAGQAVRPRVGSPFGGRRQGSSGGSGSGGRPGSGGRHRLLSQIPAPPRAAQPGQRPPKALLTGAGLSAALLVTVLATSLWSHDDRGADPTASTGASSSRTLSPTPGSQDPPAVSSPPTSAGLPTATEQTRLRNLAADLCLDIRGGTAKAGAETRLAVCSSAWTQQWSYDGDGLLRSIANPELCLDSHADNGVVFLDRCVAKSAAHGDNERYDLTVRGELLPRWNDRLAVAPASTDPDADVVVKVRDGSDLQRWRTDAASADPESLSIAGTTSPTTQPASHSPSADSTPEAPGEQPTGEPAAPGTTPSETYQEPRAVAVSDDDADDDGDASPAPALPLPVRLPDISTGVGL